MAGRIINKTVEKVDVEIEDNQDIGIREVCLNAHELALKQGWYYDGDGCTAPSIPEHLVMVHSEVSEAVEIFRKAKDIHGLELAVVEFDGSRPVGFMVELADIIIRVCGLAEYIGGDLAFAIKAKHEFNRTREHRHGGLNL